MMAFVTSLLLFFKRQDHSYLIQLKKLVIIFERTQWRGAAGAWHWAGPPSANPASSRG